MRSHRAAIAGAATLLALAAVVVPAVGSAGSCNTDWPMFQHDASRTASTTCTDIATVTAPTLAPAWFLKTDGAVTAEPAIVGGSVFVGDSAGIFRAVDLAAGTQNWSFDIANNAVHDDQHQPSYGGVTSSAAVAGVPSLGRTVYFGGGGTVYAVDAATGKPRWATDIDPASPKSSAEVESSPVVWTRANGNSVVFVGMDTNEDKGVVDGGVVALNATTGALLWKYDADSNTVVNSLTANATNGTGCGDIWTSPSLDLQRGLLFFGGGNCNLPDGTDTQRLIAISATGGNPVWQFYEPAANHSMDNDFGAAPILTHVHGNDVVVQPGKSGWVYVLDRATGGKRYFAQYHLADGGDIGGFIASAAVATIGGDPVFFGDSSVPVHTDGSVDTSITANPAGITSLHALDLATGAITWQEPAQTPSYAPTTVAGGVVFAPDTTEFSVKAFDGATGVPLWQLPIGAATAGGTAISGDNVVVGVGTFFSNNLPPQLTGIWCFRPGG